MRSGRTGTRDHPRVCGEKPESGRWGEQDAGSPPRMRGKAPRFLIAKGLFRITPAYAGKSVKVNEPDCLPRDHPRVCGEKRLRAAPSHPITGSPPRMRGKVPQPGVEGCRLGITPAYAGKSTTAGRGRMPSRDHPRVCGEKPDCRMPYSCARGSPPRVRGKDFFKRPGKEEPGITPAYAGKRLSLIV